MRANFNKKYEHDEHYDKENLFNPSSGDYFYDHIGKYCCNDYVNQVIFYEPEPPRMIRDQDSNQSCENIPEESEEKELEDEQ